MNADFSQLDDGFKLPKWDELVPFDPDEFVTAFSWAMNAASGEAIVRDPTTIKILATDAEGESIQYSFADKPITRILMAMKERYSPHDRRKYYSATLRIWALLEMMQSKRLTKWIRDVPNQPGASEVADCVIKAAAIVPLNKQLNFPKNEFIRKVKEFDAEEKP